MRNQVMSGPFRGVLLLCGALVAACGAAPPPVEHECLGGIDESDRCPTLPHHCVAGFDPNEDDGCPDAGFPEVRFAPGSSELSGDATRLVNYVCIDELWPGASFRLVAVSPELAAERIARVRAALIACAVPEALLHEGGPLPAPELGYEHDSGSVIISVDGCATP